MVMNYKLGGDAVFTICHKWARNLHLHGRYLCTWVYH